MRAARFLIMTWACTMSVACGRADLVVEPTETVAGKSAAQWAPAFWQWAYSLPAKDHPLVYDGTGDFCGTAQPQGEVFFLGPTFSEKAVRPCTVPANKTLIFPIAAVVENNFPKDPIQRSATQLETAARRTIDSAKQLRAEIDGRDLVGDEVADFARYRQKATFSFTVPDGPDNFLRGALGIDFAGSIAQAFTDGYWLMVKPLPPGSHTLRLEAELAFPASFQSSVEYKLEVQ